MMCVAFGVMGGSGLGGPYFVVVPCRLALWCGFDAEAGMDVRGTTYRVPHAACSVWWTVGSSAKDGE